MPLTIPENLHLSAGGHHPNDNNEYCFIEAWCYLRGLEWSDRPDCMSPCIAAFLRAWNDGLPEADRTRLLAPLLTREFPAGSDDVEERRGLMALDWLIRTFTPAFLRLVPALTGHADTLAALPEIVDLLDLSSAQAAGGPVRAAGAAAWNAAGNAAWNAVWATAAAWNAVWATAAAGAATQAAEWAEWAEWAAAGAAAAAGTAAGAALAAIVAELQTSALALIDRMADVSA